MRTAATATATAVLCLLGSTPATADPSAAPSGCRYSGPSLRYVVLFDPDTSRESAEREIGHHCGALTEYYLPIGVGIVNSTDPAFTRRVGADRAYSAEGALRDPDRSAHASARSGGAAVPGAAPPWNVRAIRAAKARAVSGGGDDVVVGVLDSGVDPTHPELAGALDPKRSVGCLTGSPRAGTRAWGAGESAHGTHVAGVVAAADDGHGITGVAPDVRLASVRIVDDAGRVRPEYAICGFMWAARNGIDVANSSFLVEAALSGCGSGKGSPVPGEAVRRAVKYATSEDVLTVAAVGNRRVDLTSDHERHCETVPVGVEDVVAVSAVGDDGVKAGYSSYGLGAVDLTAPGGDWEGSSEGRCVRSTVPGGYGRSCGTSMAAPHVSGVAALIASRHPEAEPRELARRLFESARSKRCPTDYDLNSNGVQDALCLGASTYNGFYGYGVVDALDAVTG